MAKIRSMKNKPKKSKVGAIKRSTRKLVKNNTSVLSGTYKKPKLFKPTKKQTKKAVSNLVAQNLKNSLIFEYKVSQGGKYYVSTNFELNGIGIKKVGNGQDHRRNLKTYLLSEKALKKLQKLFGKENTTYIQSNY
jgi:hypothetical protein